MGLFRLLREWREESDGTLTGPALSTGSLVDSDDGQAWETLREMGYESGDIVWGPSYGPTASRDISTSSTDYVSSTDTHRHQAQWDLLFPSAATTVVTMSAVVFPGSESLSLRVRNDTDGETMVEETGITSQKNLQMTPAKYTPTTTADGIQFNAEIKSDTGNSVLASDFNVVFGVEL